LEGLRHPGPGKFAEAQDDGHFTTEFQEIATGGSSLLEVLTQGLISGPGVSKIEIHRTLRVREELLR
jgi:hypothetical protein